MIKIPQSFAAVERFAPVGNIRLALCTNVFAAAKVRKNGSPAGAMPREEMLCPDPVILP